jgi:hypothetical protein
MILVIGLEILIQDYVLMTVVVNLKILLLVIVLISALQAIGEIPIIWLVYLNALQDNMDIKEQPKEHVITQVHCQDIFYLYLEIRCQVNM